METLDGYYRKSPEVYDPTDQDTFVIAVGTEEIKQRFDKDFAERLKKSNANSKQDSNFGGRGIGIFDSLKRDFTNMNLEQLCRDEKAFYLYKRAGVYQTPGLKNTKKKGHDNSPKPWENHTKKLEEQIRERKSSIKKRILQNNKAIAIHQRRGSIKLLGNSMNMQKIMELMNSRNEDGDLQQITQTSLRASKQVGKFGNNSGMTSTQTFFNVTRPKNQQKSFDFGAQGTTTRLPPIKLAGTSTTLQIGDFDKHSTRKDLTLPSNMSFDRGKQSKFSSKVKLDKNSPRFERRILSQSPIRSGQEPGQYSKMKKQIVKNLLYHQRKGNRINSRINPKFTNAVPPVKSDQIQERVKKYKLRKLQQTARFYGQKFDQQQADEKKLQDLLKSTQMKQGYSANELKTIIRKCNDTTPLKSLGNHDVDYLLFKEKVSADRLNDTLQFLLPLDNADPLTLQRFYDHKEGLDQQFKQTVDQVNMEYRLGIMDPSRDAAKCEKLSRVKKNIGKKKIMNDLLNRQAPK